MVITSVGKANFIKQNMIRDDVILIDVGFNYLDGKICGDVSSDVSKYKYLTPVPGGVGQMTVFSIYDMLTHSTVFEKEITFVGDEEVLTIPFVHTDTVNL